MTANIEEKVRTLEEKVKMLEEKSQVLEDIEAIRQLKYFYCYCADRAIGGDTSAWDDLLSRFTDDARGEYDKLGTYEGKEVMTKFFKVDIASLLSFSRHMVQNPAIEINGDKARGTWYVIVPCTLRKENLATWIEATYEEQYVKVEGQWMWKEIKASIEFFTPYDQGWVKSKWF